MKIRYCDWRKDRGKRKTESKNLGMVLGISEDDWGSDECHRKIVDAIMRKHPGWNIAGFLMVENLEKFFEMLEAAKS